MRFPENLKKGGTIGFVAPSFGCTTEPYKSAFANAQKKWKEMGYQLDLGPNCYAEHGIGISAAPEECGKELTEYYVSEKNDCLRSSHISSPPPQEIRQSFFSDRKSVV